MIRLRRPLIVLPVAAVLVAIAAGSASAVVVSTSGSHYISCDPNLYGPDDLSKAASPSLPSNTLWFTNNGSQQAWAWGVSSSGNQLPHKAPATNGTASWTGTLPSTYEWWAQAVNTTNCNGALPGNGNTTLKYTLQWTVG